MEVTNHLLSGDKWGDPPSRQITVTPEPDFFRAKLGENSRTKFFDHTLSGIQTPRDGIGIFGSQDIPGSLGTF